MDIIRYKELKQQITKAKTDPQALAALYTEVAMVLSKVMEEIAPLLSGKSPDWLPEQIKAYQEEVDQALAINVSSKIEAYLRAAQTKKPEQILPCLHFDHISMADAFCSIERQDVRVEVILMNPEDYSLIRKFGSDILDVEHHRPAFNRLGLYGRIWNAWVVQNSQVTPGKVYILGEADDPVADSIVVELDTTVPPETT